MSDQSAERERAFADWYHRRPGGSEKAFHDGYDAGYASRNSEVASLLEKMGRLVQLCELYGSFDNGVRSESGQSEADAWAAGCLDDCRALMSVSPIPTESDQNP